MATSPAEKAVGSRETGAEERIPAFAVLKNGAVLKNIFLNSPPAEAVAGGDGGEEEPPVLIGRHPECHVVVDHPSISRFHLEVRESRRRRRLTVTDRSSVHGTWVSGQRIPANTPVELAAGDTVRLGASTREYRLHWLSLREAFEMDNPLPPLPEEEKEESSTHQETSRQFVADEGESLAMEAHQETSQQVVADENEFRAKEIPSAPPLPPIFTHSLFLEEPLLLQLEGRSQGVTKEELVGENSHFSAVPPMSESGSSFLPEVEKTTPERAVQSEKRGTSSSILSRRSKSKSVSFLRVQTGRSRERNSCLSHNENTVVSENCKKEEAICRVLFDNLDVEEAEEKEENFAPDKENMTPHVPVDLMTEKNQKGLMHSISNELMHSISPLSLEDDIFSDKENSVLDDDKKMKPYEFISEDHILQVSVDGKMEKSQKELSHSISRMSLEDEIFSDKENSVLVAGKEMKPNEYISENHLLQVSVDGEMEKSQKDMKYTAISPLNLDGDVISDKENVMPLRELRPNKSIPAISASREKNRRILGSRKENLMSGDSSGHTSNKRSQKREQHKLSAKSRALNVAEDVFYPDKANSTLVTSGSMKVSKHLLKNITRVAHQEQDVFYSDKENLTPVTSGGMKVRKHLPKNVTGVADQEQDVFYSDKENLTPASSAAQKPRDMSQNRARIEREISKKRVDRIPFQTLLVNNSPLRHSNSFDHHQANVGAVDFTAADLVVRLEDELNNLSNQHMNRASDRVGEGKKVWAMVTDTDCLLDDESRKSIKLLQGLKGTCLIIPRIVIRELDCMKRREGLFRRSSKASSILQWIEECMEKEGWWIHVQSSSETLPVAPTPPATPTAQGNDENMEFTAAATFNPMAFFSRRSFMEIVSPTTEDHILDCALLFHKLRSNENMVILSNSTTLKIKAMAEGLLCEGPKEFRETLMNPCSNRFMWTASTPRGSTWSGLDEAALTETYYKSHHAVRRTPKAAEAVKGLKLILLHNSHYGQTDLVNQTPPSTPLA